MKSKKNKKDKNRKHKKEKHRRREEDSLSESSEEEMQWVEKSSETHSEVNKSAVHEPHLMQTSSKDSLMSQPQDDWLSSPFLTATTSLADIRKHKNAERDQEKEKDKDVASFDNPGQTDRELNPYWKNGGKGMPEERSDALRQSTPVVRRVGIGVDGGVSWLKKSFQRAVEQAKMTGRSTEEVVAERWGSLDEYHRLLDEAEAARRGASPSSSRGPKGPPPGWKKRREGDGDSQESRQVDRDNRHLHKQRDKYTSHDKDRDRIREDRMYDRDRTEEGDRHSDRNTHVDSVRDRRSDRDRYRNDFRSESKDRHQLYDRDYNRASGSSQCKEFMKPRNMDTHESKRSCSWSGMQSQFKRPGDDGSDDTLGSKSASSASSHSMSSARQMRKKDDAAPSWRKSGFKKPGYDDDCSAGTRSAPSVSHHMSSPSASSSSHIGRKGDAAPSWRKPGFKKAGDDKKSSHSQSIPSASSSTRDQSSPSSSHRQCSPQRSRSNRSTGDSDGFSDDSDAVQSSASSSSPDRRKGEDIEKREKERSPSPVKVLSDTEMNQLGAKLVKAEIMGNDALIQKLKAQIEEARQARIASKVKQLQGKTSSQSQKRSKREDKEEEEVILTRTDRSGQSWPIAEQEAPKDSGKKKRKKNIITHNRDGERERYFADDDNVDLQTMVRREKMGSADDHNRLLNKVASKKLMLLDSEFNTLDEMFVSSAAKGESRSKVEERERAHAITEHRRTMASLSSCPFCLDSGQMKKHLIVALGIKVYLCVPLTRCITEGQCRIIPMHHSVASTVLDEDVWNEIQIFRKGLTKMFEDHDMDAIFLETCMDPKKQRHMCIECIPVPKETGDMAPIYFKKAIQESESEWSQNKKLVDTRNKDIRKSVPKGFPYFSVDFGLDGGFAHVIEDEQLFPHYFGKEVIGGMLDVEPRLWRHPPKENFADQSKRVLQLTQWWKPFDWTHKIDRESC